MGYGNFDDDFYKIVSSKYYDLLGYKTHRGTPGDFRDEDAGSFLDSKVHIAEELAEKYSANGRACEILLRALDLATPPLGEAGLKFMKEKLGIDKVQVAVAIAEELELSSVIIGALREFVEPKTPEGLLVYFVHENFDDMPFLTYEMLKDIANDVIANSNDETLGFSPELERAVEEMKKKENTTKGAIQEKKINEKIEEALRDYTGINAALKFIEMTDLSFGYEAID